MSGAVAVGGYTFAVSQIRFALLVATVPSTVWVVDAHLAGRAPPVGVVLPVWTFLFVFVVGMSVERSARER